MARAKNGSSGPDLLRLENQVCFPLYATSRLVTRLYQPLLEPLGLTYPQYIVMMILWEDAPCPVGRVGERSLLNTNTLTPLLKRLEQMGFLERRRSPQDERVVEIHLTRAGSALRERCAAIPETLAGSLEFPVEKLLLLKSILDELSERLQEAARKDP